MGIQERKEREKEQRRNEIIKAAEQVFFTKGIENASMDEVAEKAELSKGTLYLYFKNKEALHFAICTRGLTILKSKFEKVIDPSKTMLENLIAIGFAFVSFSRENNDYFKVMSHFENKEYEFNEEDHIHSEKDDVMIFLVKMIEQGITEGTFQPDIDPHVIAHVLWAQTTGVLQLMAAKKFHIDDNDFSEDDIIMAHFEVVANGISWGNQKPDIKKYFKK